MKEILGASLIAGVLLVGAGEAVAQEPTVPEATTTTLFIPDHGDQCYETGNPESPTECVTVPLETTTTTVVEVTPEAPAVTRPARTEPLARTGAEIPVLGGIGLGLAFGGAKLLQAGRRHRARNYLSRI